MDINFYVNDYLLAWSLLFRPAISPENQQLKMKLWNTYKKQYNKMSKELYVILNDDKDYIPDDDLLYNNIFETKVFSDIKKETEKYRFHLLKIYDENKKEVKKIFSNLKINIKNSYKILLIHPKFNNVDFNINNKENRNISWAFKNDFDNDISFLIKLFYTILKYEISDESITDLDVVNSVVELMIINEFPTLLTNNTYYLQGEHDLAILKRKIYPYFLMYLGADIEDYITYMMRDKIAFDIDKYPVINDLRKMNITEFVKFCIKNKQSIMSIESL